MLLEDGYAVEDMPFLPGRSMPLGQPHLGRPRLGPSQVHQPQQR
jgi:hypothetical protein